MISPAEIRQIPRFAGIPEPACNWLADRVARKRFAKGATIFEEGADSQYLWLIESGVVKIAKFLESGRELIVGMFGPGESVGEVALLDSEGYPATAIAHQDCVCLAISRPDYFELLRLFPEVPPAIIRDLSMRMRALNRRVSDLGGGGVEYRLTRVLLALADVAGAGSRTHAVVPTRLSRQNLADMIGARTETVIRVLSRWSRENIVQWNADGFTILERTKLESFLAE